MLPLPSSERDIVVALRRPGKADQRELLAKVLDTDLPLVVDADALNLLARQESLVVPDESRPWILTPHPAEAARLLRTSVGNVQSDRVSTALELAGMFSCTVVLKGCGSIIADATGRAQI